MIQDMLKSHKTRPDMAYTAHLDSVSHNTNSSLAHIFLAPLSNPKFRLKPDVFARTVRPMLLMPQLQVYSLCHPRDGYDYPVQMCSQCAKIIDLHGGHSSFCPSARGYATRRAAVIDWQVKHYAVEAGAAAFVQPHTTDVLQNVIPQHECARIFPAEATHKMNQALQNLHQQRMDLLQLPPSGVREAALNTLLKAIDKATHEQLPQSRTFKSLTADVMLVDDRDSTIVTDYLPL